MDKQKQDDHLEPIYNSSVPIQDVALKTYRERWTIETGAERGSVRSVLAARHDHDDDIFLPYITQTFSMRLCERKSSLSPFTYEYI